MYSSAKGGVEETVIKMNGAPLSHVILAVFITLVIAEAPTYLCFVCDLHRLFLVGLTEIKYTQMHAMSFLQI